ncbi:hypothetical protein DVP45_18470 [Yersinia enterocolitica]|nr:hypothetical protein [Yersinia enterocolitica]EKN6187316.1 hypothetical protein [Yersinia enterocolitica]EKN6264010.1 hypothetical protein [Yersinia enterocolitica]EKN6343604.1 hypothetical protein [Yersinia enterocolitica]
MRCIALTSPFLFRIINMNRQMWKEYMITIYKNQYYPIKTSARKLPVLNADMQLPNNDLKQ